MTPAPDPLDTAGVERLEEMAAWLERGDTGAEGSVLLAASVAQEHSADLRALLSAFKERGEDAERYRFLRSRDPGPDDVLPDAGPFIGLVPENMILNGQDADEYIDQARALSPTVKG